MENKTSRIFDLVFCLLFMPLLIVLGPARSWALQWPLFFGLACVFLYACYFVIKRVGIPRLVIAGNYRPIAVTAVALMACNAAITLYPLPDIDFVTPAMSRYQTSVRDFSVTMGMWLMFAFVIGYAITVSFVTELYGQLLLQKKIENQRDKARLAMFKAQISPHFLFNTLNSLYSLVIGTSQKAEDAFIKFTEILKYTYVTIDREHVALREEMAYIQNYIDLQMLRLNGHTEVRWNPDIDDGGAQIPPMLLLTFVENTFKYGASTSKDCVITIDLTLHEGVLRLHTRNAVMKHADMFRTEVPAGIENCRGRLEALYPGGYSLTTSEDGGYFELDLNVKLH